jgi:Na+-transporting methylmalonyl-CoA/oxaloacetate decarboxylase gamma subunit
MDNVEILKMLFALLLILIIFASFMISLIIFRISLESDDKTEKEIKNRREQNEKTNNRKRN